MVVLDHDRIKQAHAVVMTPTDSDRPFFWITEAGRRLAGVENFTMGVLNFLTELTGEGRDSTHSLHAVQHQSLRSQKGFGFAFDPEGLGALLQLFPVFGQRADVQRSIVTMEYLFG